MTPMNLSLFDLLFGSHQSYLEQVAQLKKGKNSMWQDEVHLIPEEDIVFHHIKQLNEIEEMSTGLQGNIPDKEADALLLQISQAKAKLFHRYLDLLNKDNDEKE